MKIQVAGEEEFTSGSSNVGNSSKNKAYVRPFLAEIGCRQIRTVRIIDALECSDSSLNSNDIKSLVSSCSIFRSFLQSKPMPPPVPLDLMA